MFGKHFLLNDETLKIVEQLGSQMPGGFFIYEAKGEEKLLYVNRAVIEIFGCDGLEDFKALTGYTFRGMLHPEDYGRIFRPREEKESFFFVMNTWAGIYRLDFLREHGIRHQETPGASFQDNGFWFQTFLYAERAMVLDTPYYRVRRDNPNSSVRNPGKVYAMNREYDYIRQILEKDPAVWEEMKEVYWRQRIRNCGATLNRIAPELRKEYLGNVSREIREAVSAGEIRLADFPEEDRILAEGLQAGRFTPQPPDTDEATRLKNSASYRIGKVVTWLPGKIMNALRAGGKQK